MHYGQYKQVALRHQAMLVTHGALHRFGPVNEIADIKKDNITIDNKKIQVKIRIDKIREIKLIDNHCKVLEKVNALHN